MKIVVFTAIFGNIDMVYPNVPNALGKAAWVCFTDKPRHESGLWSYDGIGEYPTLIAPGSRQITAPTWKQEIVDAEYGNRMTARYYKTTPHRYFPDADVSIWVDGNVRLLVPPERLIKQYLPKGVDFATFAHPDRKCLYEEARVCMANGKGKKSDIQAQIEFYQKEGIRQQGGLYETKCVIRRHTEATENANELWWQQICDFSVRDQISLPYVLKNSNATVSSIPGRVALSNWPGDRNPEFWTAKHVKK